MVVLVLRIYNYEHAVFGAGLGRGNAEDAWAVLLARDEEKRVREQLEKKKKRTNGRIFQIVSPYWMQ